MSVEFRPGEFRPARWLGGPHRQTLGARVLRSTQGVPLRRERLTTPDADFVDLDFAFGASDAGDHRPLVLVLHGLEGCARSGYAIETYRALHRRGIASVGLNFRSCSGQLNRLPRLYHSGDTGDLAFILRELARRWPDRAIGLVGFSLGGNVVLKYLGEAGETASSHVRAAAAVSVPYDLSAGADYLVRPAGWIYTTYLLRRLQDKVRAKAPLMPEAVDVERALSARTFREFDDAATAPLHGFVGAEDYYRRSSSGTLLGGIRVPTLLVHSSDDPFLPARCVPKDIGERNPHVVTAFSRRGGHVGFVSGALGRPVFWAEDQAGRFMAEVLLGDTGR